MSLHHTTYLFPDRPSTAPRKNRFAQIIVNDLHSGRSAR